MAFTFFQNNLLLPEILSMKIGIIKEGKIPPDSRVPLTPKQCSTLIQQGLDLVVQKSPNRSYSDEEYTALGIPLVDDVKDCSVLLGVKEVPIDQLIANKTYFFFSHTIKEQPYNRKLLQTVLQKNIRLIDYEVLTDDLGRRLIAFGFFAGMVGAYNGLLTYGTRAGDFTLKRMHLCRDYADAKSQFGDLTLPPIKIVLTGTGRVASGAVKVLRDMRIKQVTPAEFLKESFSEIVFTQLDCEDYAERKDGKPFQLNDFFKNPDQYKSIFSPYSQVADLMINGIYWDNQAPAFFRKESMNSPDFSIEVIADITCDIAPESSIPSTLRATTIADPVFGYDPHSEQEVQPYQERSVDMMTIDNLPNEMPRDASSAFGDQFIEQILPEMLKSEPSEVIERGTIANNGKLTAPFEYLQAYLEGK